MRTVRPSSFLAIFLTVMLATATATATVTLADSVDIEPVRDNTLLQDPTGALSNGSGPHLFAGATSMGSLRRAVLAFDVAAAVPPGSVVTAATLTLNMDQANPGPRTVALHRVSAAWGEGASSTGGGSGAPSEDGDATWIHTFYADGFWANPGGDFVASSASTVVDLPDFYSWGSTPGMVADVQGWLDQPATNHGWLLRGDESSAATAKRFDSRNNNNVGIRPILTVAYEPAPGDDEDEDDDQEGPGDSSQDTDLDARQYRPDGGRHQELRQED